MINYAHECPIIPAHNRPIIILTKMDAYYSPSYADTLGSSLIVNG